MKKQVTFDETKFHSKVRRLQQNGTTPRSTGSHYSNRAQVVNVNLGDGLGTHRGLARGQTPKNQNMNTIQIHKIMPSAPFLESSELTPGQKRYLYSIVDTYSTAHVRKLIQRHYMNVLHRCIRTGQDPVRDIQVMNLDVGSLPYENDDSKHSPPEAFNRSKNSGHKRTEPPGKTTLPKIPKQYLRTSSDKLTSKQKYKKRTRVITLKKSRQRIPESKLGEDDLDFDLGQDDADIDLEKDDSLSECMSSLSMEDWGGGPMTATPIQLPDL